ncbi:glycoside hydrolase family 95 protein [Alteromonas sp. D210916BOD_24]|uniref:glycoside hydrolase family 95 protein n=1 Tax=Alteromonas sp. D210916BOD_24 TaxID=3157618 RepID=UPI00399C8CDF
MALTTVLSSTSLFATEALKHTDNPLLLKYHSPGIDWESQSLPLGNGVMGATVLGGVESDTIQINEKSLWTGGPGSIEGYNFGFPSDYQRFTTNLNTIQAQLTHTPALSAEHVASKLGHKQTGYGSYQSFGDLILNWPKAHQFYQDYQRILNLNTATASVSYRVDDVNYSRTYFVSYPDNSLVIKLTSDKPEKVTVSGHVTFPENRSATVTLSAQNTALFDGKLNNNGLQFAAGLQVTAVGGKTHLNESGHFSVTDADSVQLIFTGATNYALNHPTYRGESALKKAKSQLAHTTQLDYPTLYQRHVDDYQRLFQRVSLNLGGTQVEDMENALAAYPSTNPSLNRAIEALYFLYGRYLLIASSRDGALPANLQGIWNKDIEAPWSADYHLNINLQMNYWLANSTNLPETLTPFYQYIENLMIPGQLAASRLFGSRGWVVFLNSNPWGSIGLIEWPTAFWQPEAAAWLALQFYDGYTFSQDPRFLKEHVYPLLKLSSQFWLDNLVLSHDNQSFFVSPSYSPEHGDFTNGAAMSQQIVYALFEKTKHVAREIGDDVFATQITKVLAQLEPGLVIGQWGQLQEWREDLDDKDDKHRHVSHLFALHPGDTIDVRSTPALAQAAKTTLNARGDAGTGWSRAWKINFWARLHDGDRALRLLQHQLRDSTLSNLWSTHPPFQIDGNFGATAGVAEMLVQSHLDELHLLPALPNKWASGQVSGLRGRGNFEISMNWNAHRLTKAVITSHSGGVVRVRNNGFNNVVVVTQNNALVPHQKIDDTAISFNTSANQEYAVIVADQKQ